MFNWFDSMFLSPLGREYCDLFFFTTLIYIIAILGVIGWKLYYILIGKDKPKDLLNTLYFLSPLIYAYFVNRILYGMCIR